MSWGAVRQQVYDKQGGCCSVCGLFLDKHFVIHHKKNRCRGGNETLENAEARHAECEKLMHRLYEDGNYPRRWDNGKSRRRRS
jgi:5-methylcytosine-specific restriction endonuclease McrA